MCGIAIIINKEINNPFDHGNMEKMVLAIRHRGPDGNGIHKHNGVTLGHTRLSILDLSELGSQPMHFGDYSIVYNGEIYNYKVLRKELENLGYSFKTQTDTEVILVGFKEWGTLLFHKLSGMFAFCIYDRAKGETIVVRDPFGIKPIYFYKDNDRLIFASEIKPIRTIVSASDLSLNSESIGNIIQFLYVQGNKTLFSEINKVEAGCYLKINCSTLSIDKVNYWKLEKNDYYIKKFEEAKSKVETLLVDSIKENLISDVPVGLFLSGGIDSSLICAIASKYSHQPIHSFSLGFTESGKFLDESKYSQIVANQYKTIHHTKKIDIAETMNCIEHTIKKMDAPNADASVFMNHIISEFAADYVKVCISGIGGDELFGGYNRYQAMLLNPLISKMPESVKNWLLKNNKIISSRTNKFGNLSRALNKILESSDSDPEKSYLKLISYQKMNDQNLSLTYKDLNDIMIWDIENYMVNNLLSITDQMSMANSLEVRVPFLNTELANLAFRISPKLKTSLNSKKIILKSIASNYLDYEIIQKRKQGFSAPIEIWFNKQNAAFYLSTFINGPIGSYVDHQTISAIVHGFYIDKKDYSNQLYALYVLNCWLDN